MPSIPHGNSFYRYDGEQLGRFKQKERKKASEENRKSGYKIGAHGLHDYFLSEVFTGDEFKI